MGQGFGRERYVLAEPQEPQTKRALTHEEPRQDERLGLGDSKDRMNKKRGGIFELCQLTKSSKIATKLLRDQSADAAKINRAGSCTGGQEAIV